MELAEEQPVRVDTDHAVSTGAEHAPHVVTIAAADVEDALAGKVQMRRDRAHFQSERHSVSTCTPNTSNGPCATATAPSAPRGWPGVWLRRRGREAETFAQLDLRRHQRR